MSGIGRIHLLLAAAWIFVAAAEESSVNASSFGFDASDATACLQKAIDSGAKRVVVDDVGREWLSGPLYLRSGLEFVIADGVVLQAKPGLFHGLNDCFLNVLDVENVVIRGGKNSILRMNRSDYQDQSRYRMSEWRHAIAIRGSRNVALSGLTVDGSGGDGVALGRGKRRIAPENIRITDMSFINHHRLAVGCVTVKGLRIERCKFLNTDGTAPNGGLDFEPNFYDEPLTDILVKDCFFSGNRALGLMFIFVNHDTRSEPVSARIEDCRIENNHRGGIMIGASRAGLIEFVRCRIGSGGVQAVRLCDFTEHGMGIRFSGCILDNNGAREPAIGISSNAAEDFGNVDFGDMQIIDNTDREAISVQALGDAGIADNLRGNPVVLRNGKTFPVALEKIIAAHRQEPNRKRFLTAQFLPRLFRAPATGAPVRTTEPIQLRGRSRFTQWLPKETTVHVTFQLHKVTGYELQGDVEVFDTNGNLFDRFTLDDKPKVYTLKSGHVPTTRTFSINSRQNTVTVSSDVPGFGMPADRMVRFYTGNHELYFWVTPDQKTVQIEVFGEEPLCAALCDAAGRKVAEAVPSFRGSRILSATRTPSAKPELWKVKFDEVVEDYRACVGAPAVPVFFTAPSNAAEYLP